MDKHHKKAKKFLHQGLFNAVSSFEEFEGRVESLDSKQDKGDAFEVFAQAYLATQKIVQAKTVWTFDDIPQKIRSNLSIDTRVDMGVDGAFKMNTGEQCAYQVKFRTGRPYLTWTELSTFMGLTEQADKRVLFTNCDDIPGLMNDRSNFYCIRGSDLDQLEKKDFDAIKAWLSAGRVKHKAYTPKPHQKTALRLIKKSFKTADRATVVMACGTGKTLVQLWAAEQLDVKNILVLLPSLALVRQTLHEWLKHTTVWGNPSFMCVCSDPTVTRGDDVVVKQSELDFPVSTVSADVTRYLKSRVDGPRIIFSTYQSAQVVAAGMSGRFKFDLGFFDEAHKTAGREGTKFAFALTDDNLKIKKRLFMTATPRHYNVQKKDNEGDSKLVYSMDVPELYGEVAYKLPFRQAVDDDLICDYKVLISVVTDEEIDNWQLSHGEVVVQGDVIKARQVANQIALKNAVDKYGVQRIFTFHATVKSAASFTSSGGEGINSELPDFLAVHVSGAMPSSKRSQVMREFTQAKKAVISNARCLTEGVDVPAVDMVAFLSPKKSKVDIVQATGRAMRNSPGKEAGYVLVPLYLEQEKGESIEEALDRTDFGEIWNVLQAMKEQDEELADIISEIQQERGKTGGYDDGRLSEHLEVIGPALTLATLRNSVITQCVEWLGDNWDLRFGELIVFNNAHGHCNVPKTYSKNQQLARWVNNQRNNYKKGKLDSDRVKRLEKLSFEWDLFSTIWMKRFNELVAYMEEHGDCNVPLTYLKNSQLGKWVSVQRQFKVKGKLESDRVKRLEELGFEWGPFATKWEKQFKELVDYKEEHGDCNVTRAYSKNPQLAWWVNTQRQFKVKGKLESDRVKRLEELDFEWDPFSIKWEKQFKELVGYKEEHGDCNVPVSHSKLGGWVDTQRQTYKRGNLDADQACRLEDLGFIWDPISSFWEKRFKELVAYKKKHGDFNVPFAYSKNPQLGKWVNKQRNNYKKGKLDSDRVKLLEELGFEWDQLSAIWDLRFGELVTYKEEHGDCNVPQRYSNNQQLATWVNSHRDSYKKGKLDSDRVKRLEELGFEWGPFATKWEKQFKELVDYKEEHGDCNVPQRYSNNQQLAAWVCKQRTVCRKGKLGSDCVKRLEELGFEWDPKSYRWEKQFKELVAYKEEFGDCDIPAKWSSNPQLGAWLSTQRQAYKKGKLKPDCVRCLEEIGFKWSIKK